MAKSKKICERCGCEFMVENALINRGGAKFCSIKCSRAYISKETRDKMSKSRKKYLAENPQIGENHPNWKGGLYNKFCPDCGKKITKLSVRCRPCAKLYLVKKKNPKIIRTGYIPIICDYCGKEHQQKLVNYNPKGEHHFCDKKCEMNWKSENIRGDKCGSWKGGITPIYQGIRLLRKYKQWRTAVFERDNYKCMRCNNGGYIEAHHKIKMSEIIKKYNIKTIEDAICCLPFWNMNNGETLCDSCHKQEHKLRRTG